jgi:hypothetical protein
LDGDPHCRGDRNGDPHSLVALMGIAFKVKSGLRERRWRKYWAAQDDRNHIEFYRVLAAEWRASR